MEPCVFLAPFPNNISFEVFWQFRKVTPSVNCQYQINFAGQMCFGSPIMEGFILYLPSAHSHNKIDVTHCVMYS